MSATANAPLETLPSADRVMAQARDENFPVASLILGRRYRTHLRAIYGFARLVDDIGDEASGDREALLDCIAQQLSQIYAGQDPAHRVMHMLRRTVDTCDLPQEPFLRLLEANRRDQVVTRYQDFEQLLSYCQLSAAPVGELVLHVFAVATPQRLALSDRVCAGLQVIEHLQDVAEDHARGRIYLPHEDLVRFGCHEADLEASSASPALRSVIAELATRSRELLDAGPPLMRQLSGRARLALAGFVGGGRATLAALDQAAYDVLARRPSPTRRAFAASFWQLVSGR